MLAPHLAASASAYAATVLLPKRSILTEKIARRGQRIPREWIPGDLTAQAIDLMLATGQGRLPVTDPQTGVLVGLITRKDLLQVRAAVARSEHERRAYFAPVKQGHA